MGRTKAGGMGSPAVHAPLSFRDGACLAEKSIKLW